MNQQLPSLEELSGQKEPNQKLMGLDLGTKTIGIAFSDVNLTVATARRTLVRTKFTRDVEALLEEIKRENVFAIVLGLPYNMDGTQGKRAQSTRAFVSNFKRHSQIPVFFQDERLSSFAADQAMLEANMSRQKRGEKIDAVAAAIILQAALDKIPDTGRCAHRSGQQW